MAIRFSNNAPQDAHQRIQSHLSAGQTNSAAGGPRLFSAEDSIDTSNGIQTWTLNLDEINAESIEAAKAGDWRYIVFEEDQVVSEVLLDGSAGAQGVSSTSYGPLPVSLVKALNVAEQHLLEDSHNYEPRVFHVPSVVFSALWLHSDETEDVFIPISPSSSSLSNFEPASEHEVLRAISDEAKRVLESIDSAPGPSGGSGGSDNDDGQLSDDDSYIDKRFGGKLPTSFSLNRMEFTSQPKPGVLAPSSGGAAAKRLPSFMQSQKQTNWCWSAVATSVGLLLKTGTWTQCNTATGCLPGQNCCPKPSPCNVYGYLNKSLTFTKSFDSYSGSPATLATIIQEINKGRPVCTRVAWNGGGAHFMAITGYDGSDITIQDSIYGTSTMAYIDYASRYQSGGTWSHTYYTKP